MPYELLGTYWPRSEARRSAGQREAVQPDVVSACTNVRARGREGSENIDTDTDKTACRSSNDRHKTPAKRGMPEEGLEPPTTRIMIPPVFPVPTGDFGDFWTGYWTVLSSVLHRSERKLGPRQRWLSGRFQTSPRAG